MIPVQIRYSPVTTISLRYRMPYVDWSTWPAPGGVRLLLLTDQENHILQGLTFPRAFSADAAIVPVFPSRAELLEGSDRLEYLEVARSLQLKMTGGVDVNVSAFLAALVAEFHPSSESYQDLNVTAGDSVLTSTPVPANKVRLLTEVTIMCYSSSVTRLGAFVVVAGTPVQITDIATPAVGRWHCSSVNLWIQTGDWLRALIYGATAGDGLYLRFSFLEFDRA